MLGSVKELRGDDPHAFRKMIEVYADSSNERADLAYWPLVKRICLKGPWDILRSGAILVQFSIQFSRLFTLLIYKYTLLISSKAITSI